MRILLAREPIKHNPEPLEIQITEENEKKNLIDSSQPIFEYEMKVENINTILLEKQEELDNHEAQLGTTDEHASVYDILVKADSLEESCIEDSNRSPALDVASLPSDFNIEDLFNLQNTSKYDEEDGNISTVRANTVIDKRISTENILDSYKADIFPNTEEFLCPLCLQLCSPGDGMLLQNCSDPVCRKCMKIEILTSDYSLIKCPYYNCFGILNHCEIRCLLSTDDFEMFIQRSVRSVILYS